MKRWLTILMAGLVLPVISGGLEDMQGLDLKHLKIPFYKNQKLQLLVFAESGQKQERLMAGYNTMLDILLPDVNVDKIPDGWQTKLYPLGASMPEVLKFWEPRCQISQAVIFTAGSSIDQRNGEVFGDRPVFLRTPMFDLNGHGFKADFNQQVIEISSEVKIIVRDAGLDPRKLLAGAPMPKNQRLIHAESRQLRLDQKNNKIMLIGDVKVIDGRNILTCDRLTVFLDRSEKNAGENKTSAEDEKAVLSGVTRVLADGEVLLRQYPEDAAKIATELQSSNSEHLEYDVRRGLIVLTGDHQEPTLTRGSDTELRGKRIELLRHEDKMFVMQNCRITSLVRDQRGMLIYARKISSDRANFDGRNNVANFHGNVVASDQNTTLYTDSLRAHLSQAQGTSSHQLELLFGNGNVKIVSRSEKEVSDKDGKKVVRISSIASQQAELNYRKNKLVFFNAVKVRDQEASLDCRRLDLFLADRNSSGAKSKVSGSPMAAGMEGRNKTVTRMIANGEVVMVSGKDELHTDMLTLQFRELPPGVKPSPGMIQSGGVQLTKIFCDGSVKALSHTTYDRMPSQRILKAGNAMSDLLKDYSEFHGDVSVVDGNTEIHCRDMYIFTGASPIDEVIEDNVLQNGMGKSGDIDLDDEDLDADPFALDMGENSVPTRIAVSDPRDLKRIVCQKEVVLLRRDNKGKLQRAGGDRAVYTVNTREVVLTANRPRRPWLRSEGRKQFCDIIRSDMESEDLRGIGNVVVMPDDEK